MSKVRIKLILVGHLPLDFQFEKIVSWKSNLFEIVSTVDTLNAPVNPESYDLRKQDFRAQGHEWEYTDVVLKDYLPANNPDSDFILAITNVPLEKHHSARRLGDNKTVATFFGLSEMLEQYNIPLENLILRALYNYTLIYLRCGNRLPSINEEYNFAHDETRGCLYDLRAIKTDLLASLDKPTLCKECSDRLLKERVSRKIISTTLGELKQVRKILYYRILDLIKKYPLQFLIISILFSILAGVIDNVAASYLYDYLQKGRH